MEPSVYKQLFGAPVVYHCIRCDRPLKRLVSIRRGYGPKCWSLVRTRPSHPQKVGQRPPPFSDIETLSRECNSLVKVFAK